MFKPAHLLPFSKARIAGDIMVHIKLAAAGSKMPKRIAEMKSNASDQNRGDRNEQNGLSGLCEFATHHRPLVFAEQLLHPLERDRIHIPGIAGDVVHPLYRKVVRRVEAVIHARGKPKSNESTVAECVEVNGIAEQIAKRVGKPFNLVEPIPVDPAICTDDRIAWRHQHIRSSIYRPGTGLERPGKAIVHRTKMRLGGIRKIEIRKHFPGRDRSPAHNRIFDFTEPANESRSQPPGQTVGKKEVDVFLSNYSAKHGTHRVVSILIESAVHDRSKARS